MGEGLLQVVRQVGIFMICAQMIMHFKPAESYGKYIRLLTSIMVLVQLIVPVMEIFGGKGTAEFGERVLYYDEIMEQNRKEINITGVTAEKMLETMTIEEIKSRINNQKLIAEQEGGSKDGEGQDNSVEDSVVAVEKDNLAAEERIQIDRIEVTDSD